MFGDGTKGVIDSWEKQLYVELYNDHHDTDNKDVKALLERIDKIFDKLQAPTKTSNGTEITEEDIKQAQKERANIHLSLPSLLAQTAIALDDSESLKIILDNIDNNTSPGRHFKMSLEIIKYAMKSQDSSLLEHHALNPDAFTQFSKTFNLEMILKTDDDFLRKLEEKRPNLISNDHRQLKDLYESLLPYTASGKETCYQQYTQVLEPETDMIGKTRKRKRDVDTLDPRSKTVTDASFLQEDITKLYQALKTPDYKDLMLFDANLLNIVNNTTSLFSKLSQKDKDNILISFIKSKECTKEQLKFAISIGADIEAKDNKGNTPLHFAAWQGNTETALKLIGEGADIEAKNNYGNTPLHFAAWQGNTETALKLIEKGADINAKSHVGNTPLHEATWKGNTETALKLIEKGADINAKNNKGNTPLHIAIEKNHTDLALKLIEKGANIYANNRYGFTPMRSAASRNDNYDFYYKMQDLYYNLFIQAKNGNIDSIKYILGKPKSKKSKIDKLLDSLQKKIYKFLKITPYINELDQNGDTALIIAINNGHQDVAKELLSQEADVNIANKSGETPLHLAAKRGYTDLAIKLISEGADINAKDQREETPLHIAAKRGYTDLAIKLISEGADINAKDIYGNTPLHFAAWQGNTETALKLIEKGANINAKDNNGNTPLHFPAWKGYTDLALKLIGKGADINAKNNYGNTPLYLAAMNNHTETAQKLMEERANKNTQNNNGETPPHQTDKRGHSDNQKTSTPLPHIKIDPKDKAVLTQATRDNASNTANSPPPPTTKQTQVRGK